MNLLYDCPDCDGHGHDEEGAFCYPCDGTGLLCDVCGLPEVDCPCDEAEAPTS